MSRAEMFPRLSTVALILSVTGLLVPPAGLAAIIVGVIAVKLATTPRQKRFAQAAIGVSCAGFLVLGSLILIDDGSGDSSVDCQVGLEALSLAQEAHRKTRGRYALSQEELGVPVAERFYLAPGGEQLAVLTELKVGAAGQCPACALTMACREPGSGRWWTQTTGGKPVPHGAR